MAMTIISTLPAYFISTTTQSALESSSSPLPHEFDSLLGHARVHAKYIPLTLWPNIVDPSNDKGIAII